MVRKIYTGFEILRVLINYRFGINMETRDDDLMVLWVQKTSFLSEINIDVSPQKSALFISNKLINVYWSIKLTVFIAIMLYSCSGERKTCTF